MASGSGAMIRGSGDTWWDKGAKLGAMVAAVCGVLGILGGGLIYWKGSAVNSNHLSELLSTLGDKVTRLSGEVNKLQDQIAQMPRPIDYATQSQRIAELAGKHDALSDRVYNDEAKNAGLIGDLAARVTRLEAGTQTPVRSPRNP